MMFVSVNLKIMIILCEGSFSLKDKVSHIYVNIYPQRITSSVMRPDTNTDINNKFDNNNDNNGYDNGY